MSFFAIFLFHRRPLHHLNYDLLNGRNGRASKFLSSKFIFRITEKSLSVNAFEGWKISFLFSWFDGNLMKIWQL